MADEQSLSVALALVERGILTRKAARLFTHFSTSTRLMCEALRMPNGDVGIFWRHRYFTPAEFNALADDRYPPTPDDVVASIRALALAADPDVDADAAAASEPEPAPEADPASPPLPAPGSPEAEAELERLHQAASQRPGGAGALALGALLLAVWVLVALAALGIWHVVELFWPR